MHAELSVQPLPCAAQPVRLLLAAADAATRRSLREHAGHEPRLHIVGEAGDAIAAIVLSRRLQPDILLLDSSLVPDLTRNLSPVLRIVVIVAAGLPPILEAFDLGATGVLRNTSLPHLWKTALDTILAGDFWLDQESIALLLGAAREFRIVPDTPAHLHSPDSPIEMPSPAPDDARGELSGDKPLPVTGLTPREREIAAKIAHGLPNKHVAREFSIQERTVKHHLTNIFRKLGVSSRLELALLVRDRTHALLSGLPLDTDLLPSGD